MPKQFFFGFIDPYIYIYIYIYIYLVIYLFIYLSIYLFIYFGFMHLFHFFSFIPSYVALFVFPKMLLNWNKKLY